MKVKMNLITDIYDFLKFCMKTDGDITVSQGRNIVNGSSLLGIFSLDLSKEVIVDIESNDESTKEEFYQFIEKWRVV